MAAALDAQLLRQKKTRNKMKLPLDLKDLLKFYDGYIEEKRITDKAEKHRIWWAMFYCAKEGREWISH